MHTQTNTQTHTHTHTHTHTPPESNPLAALPICTAMGTRNSNTASKCHHTIKLKSFQGSNLGRKITIKTISVQRFHHPPLRHHSEYLLWVK
mmetsp:Transcript_39491/g.64271  ORF Transcript_39491/g.64271 Transcript_39491/m.64271 type:complete len:91 (+) Transcript_39491:456-728(+)